MKNLGRKLPSNLYGDLLVRIRSRLLPWPCDQLSNPLYSRLLGQLRNQLMRHR